jgi:hypothetical protein
VDLAPDGGGVEQVSSPVGSETGSPVGFGLFYFFNSLTEAGKPTTSVIHRLTVTFAWRRLPSRINHDICLEAVGLPASENEKQPPPLIFLVVVLERYVCNMHILSLQRM